MNTTCTSFQSLVAASGCSADPREINERTFPEQGGIVLGAEPKIFAFEALTTLKKAFASIGEQGVFYEATIFDLLDFSAKNGPSGLPILVTGSRVYDRHENSKIPVMTGIDYPEIKLRRWHADMFCAFKILVVSRPGGPLTRIEAQA